MLEDDFRLFYISTRFVFIAKDSVLTLGSRAETSQSQT